MQGHSAFHEFHSPMLSECVLKLLSILIYLSVSTDLHLPTVQIHTSLTERHLASLILSLSALSVSASAGEHSASQGIFTVSQWRHQSIHFPTGTLPTWVLVVWGVRVFFLPLF